MEQLIAQKLMAAAQAAEEQVDAELEKLERLDEDDLEGIRQQRLQAMKQKQHKMQEWRAQGHGEYTEIPEEKEFFEVSRKSQNVVVHFYRDSFFRCKVLDKHLNVLAKKHVETKFCKINAEKCPFLTERLKIKVLPTLALIKDAKTRDYVVGFTDLGNTDDFSTEMLEWRIAQADVIDYQGDLLTPPTAGSSKSKLSIQKKKKTIRERDSDDGSDSDD